MPGLNVAIVGATGAVGRTLLSLFAERRFPIAKLRLLATARSAGEERTFAGQSLPVEEVAADALGGHDVVFFSAGADAARRWAPEAVSRGAVVIDNSQAFRLDPQVPLVVPEVNAHRLHDRPRLVANPNCSTIQLVLVLAPLHRRARLSRVVVSTYQSVSGTGLEALAELDSQIEGQARGQEPAPRVYPRPIAYNCIPQVDDFLENGYSREEMKIVQETRKLLEEPDLAVTATTVRVPVRVGHSESVNLSFARPVTPEEARRWLAEAPGVLVIDDPARGLYPTPRQAEGGDTALVGRIRRDLSQEAGLDLWICSDNLRKGAALNAVQIAECLFVESARSPDAPVPARARGPLPS
jgi:aspartate-semialdehyde dehydrogenase